MTTPMDDDALMQLLAEAEAAREHVSDQARTAARAAFAWRTIDDELMELTFDSGLADALAVRDAPTDTRVVGFRGTALTLELERDGEALVGQVVPGRACTVTLITRAGEVADTTTDESGFFSLALVGQAPWRLRVEVDGQAESTGWLTL